MFLEIFKQLNITTDYCTYLSIIPINQNTLVHMERDLQPKNGFLKKSSKSLKK